MMLLIPAHNADKYPELIDQMFRLRARVFSNRLGWSVEVRNGRERDKYDDLEPLYALALSDDGDVIGTFRLLQTTGPHMLADVFHELMPDGVPVRSPLIWESTRFCVDTERAKARGESGLADVTSILLSSLLEVGLHAGLTHILTVIDVRMERILRRAGCPIDRLSDPKRIGDVPSLAILMECTEDSVARVHRTNGIERNCIEPRQLTTAMAA